MRMLFGLLLLCVSVLGVSSQTFVLDGASNTSNWVVVGAAAPNQNPPLDLVIGNTYTFNLNAVTGHPFGFSSAQNAGSGTLTALDNNYNVTATGCTVNSGGYSGNPCSVTLAIKSTATPTTLWYKCTLHPPMTARLNIVAASGSSSSSSSSGGNNPSASSSSSSGGNNPPAGSSSSSTGNNPPGTSSSSTGNTASTIAGTGLAIMVAFIASVIMMA